ncbi:hypothetical protein SSS_08686 [Sarcoptes scabiei]|uniref:WKF domain-containing protein n=1 Tax=Sarcoptes scabiei TaxID=52283 RepID=A0A132A006_SARSC|nr:hypothetical protein SSS_08686 [Sarcoptes scabiei]KPM03690.1 hypothetical protein QR98_0021240 [Sarcoptes scabiei]UXI14952.1 hypothetical protein NH340_JMT00895 [Sarcoptes scabiei]
MDDRINELNDDDLTDDLIKRDAINVLDEINDLKKENLKNKKKLNKRKKKAKNLEKEFIKTGICREKKSEKALSYLKQWRKHRDEWKFKKIYHLWLLKNWTKCQEFPDKRFRWLLKYLHAQDSNANAIHRIIAEAKNFLDNPEVSKEISERSQLILQWLAQ